MTDFDSYFKKTKIKPEEYDDVNKKLKEMEEEDKRKKSEMDAPTRSLDDLKKPEVEDNPELDERIKDKVYGKKRRIRFRRPERKMIEDKEYEGVKSRVGVVIAFTIIGLMFVVSMQYIVDDEWVIALIILLGSMMFLPFGMILGWAMLDPYVRCKILRKTTKRNYGIINFVGKGQKIVSKVKNFDNTVVWKKNEAWVITKEHVYQLTKDGDTIVEKHKIDPESIVTLIDTVPVLYVDIDSMQPLSLARDRREGINPQELGATLKAWVDNQLAKSMFLKKTMDAYFIIIIVCAVASVGVGYLCLTRMDDLEAQLNTIQSQLGSVLTKLT